MDLRKSRRPVALFGAALLGAGAIMTAPAVLPAQSARAVAADFALTALDWSDIEFETPGGWITFESAVEAQAYADELAAALLLYGQTAVQWSGWLDPFLSLAGISGVADWVSSRFDLVEDILSDGWDPIAWAEEFFTAINADPEVLFGPVADVDLGWFWGLLGISGSDGDQLDSLFELASGLAGGALTFQVLSYAANAGVINAVVDGVVTLDDLFPSGWEGEVPDFLGGDTFANWLIDTEAELTSQLEIAADILEASPVVQWILDIVTQLSDGAGFEIPF